jgi:RNA polymerase sigma-70 factor (ECF subfamily)
VASAPDAGTRQDRLYVDAAAAFGAPLARLARGYEPDPDRCRDLLQEFHLALWRSLASFDERCSLRTWVFRVAHNVAMSQVVRRRGRAVTTVPLDAVDLVADVAVDRDEVLDRKRALDRLTTLIQRLETFDRQVILLYLEGLDAASIAEITGTTAGNVATKVHRIKRILAARFNGATA